MSRRRWPTVRTSGAALRARAAGALLLLASVSVVGGCAGGDRFRPEQIARGDSVIYVYRRGAPISPGPILVVVDQTEIARLAPGQYVAAIVPPGEHLVRVQRRSAATRSITLSAGESAFFEGGVSLLGGRASLDRPPDEIARERISGARAATPEPARVSQE